MGLNSTPSAQRLHIAFFGKRNVGKSSLVNAVTVQNISLVSDIKGTTTDPVYKTMELLPLGPVTIIDTAGIDDEGTLGSLRVEKTLQILNKIDIAVLVVSALEEISVFEKELIKIFEQKEIKYVIAYNKCDLIKDFKNLALNEIYVSAKNNINIGELKELIISIYDVKKEKNVLVSDLVQPNDIVILVTPIDSSAPKGRLILPQQQVIRELLDSNVIVILAKDTEFELALKSCNKKPKLVITDSQVFGLISKKTPNDVFLTSFSILFARYKGILFDSIDAVQHLDKLKDGDTILIAEGCTHHRQCDDIGTVKLPKWIKDYTKKNLNFEFSSGTSFPLDLKKYSLIVHCGGCMLKEQEILYRYKIAKKQKIPITNYGIIISFINGILSRSTEIFQ